MAKYDDRDTRSRELQDLFTYFSNYRAANYEDNADRWYKLYTGYLEPLDEDDDRSNLHIPMTYEAVDTWRARLLTSFFGNRRPYFDFLPLPMARISPEEMIANAEKANLAACLYDMQLERNNIVALGNDYFTSRLVFPAAILGVGWKREEKTVKRRKPKHIPADAEGLVDQIVLEIEEEKLVTFDDNQIELIDYMDFWTDPMGKTFDSSRGCFNREFLNKRELEDLMDNYSDVFRDFKEGKVYKLNIGDIRSSGFHPQNTAFDRVSFYGENPPYDYDKYRCICQLKNPPQC